MSVVLELNSELVLLFELGFVCSGGVVSGLVLFVLCLGSGVKCGALLLVAVGSGLF